MFKEQIGHMVTRFLGWKLPASFAPDAGISFKATFNDHMPHYDVPKKQVGKLGPRVELVSTREIHAIIKAAQC